MDSVIEIIVQLLAQNAGAIEWQAMVDAIPFQDRRWIIPALRQLQADGIAKRQVRSVPDAPPVHEIVSL